MFRLSKITDYGIVILAHLARSGDATPAHGDGSDAIENAREVAAAVDLPLPIVSKVLKSLARHGVLSSHRGSKGGFSLNRAPQDITVEEMIAALQGPVALTECSSALQACQIEEHCPVRDPWQVINRVVQVALSKITLADLIDPTFSATASTLQILSRAPRPRMGTGESTDLSVQRGRAQPPPQRTDPRAIDH